MNYENTHTWRITPFLSPGSSQEQLISIATTLSQLGLSPIEWHQAEQSKEKEYNFVFLVFTPNSGRSEVHTPTSNQKVLEILATDPRVRNLEVILPHDLTDINENAPHLATKKIHASRYHGIEFLLIVEEAAKRSIAQYWQSLGGRIGTHIFSIQCPDRPGILLDISDVIELLNGLVVFIEQLTHQGTTTLHAVSRFSSIEDAASAEATIKEKLGLSAQVSRIRPPAESQLVHSRSIFTVYLHTRPGVTKGIFSVFAQERMSIIQCTLHTADEASGFAHLKLTLNSDGITDPRIDHLLTIIRSKAGVVAAEVLKLSGSWLSGE